MNKKGITFWISTIMVIVTIILVAIIFFMLLMKGEQKRDDVQDILFSGTQTQTLLTTFLRAPYNVTAPDGTPFLSVDDATNADLIRTYINEDDEHIYGLLRSRIHQYFSPTRHPNNWQLLIFYYDQEHDLWFRPKNSYLNSPQRTYAYFFGSKLVVDAVREGGAFWTLRQALPPVLTRTEDDILEGIIADASRAQTNREKTREQLFRRGNYLLQTDWKQRSYKIITEDEGTHDKIDLIISQAYQVIPNYHHSDKPLIVVVLYREEYKK